MTPKHKQILDDARKEEIRLGHELLVAAQRRYDGDMDEDEFAGFVCRYGHAALSRRILVREIAIEVANANRLN